MPLTRHLKGHTSGGTTFKNSSEERNNDMEFLKAILGEELFKQLVAKLDAYNGDEANKDKQVKLGNLLAKFKK